MILLCEFKEIVPLKRLLMVTLLSVILLLAGCNGDGGDSDSDDASDNITATEEVTNNDGAAEAVINYLEAKVAGDEEGVASWICSEMEASIQAESLSFASVEASLSEDAACIVESIGDTVDGFTLVSCVGQIEAVYQGGEDRNFELTSYRTIEEDGEWRWCGEG